MSHVLDFCMSGVVHGKSWRRDRCATGMTIHKSLLDHLRDAGCVQSPCMVVFAW